MFQEVAGERVPVSNVTVHDIEVLTYQLWRYCAYKSDKWHHLVAKHKQYILQEKY